MSRELETLVPDHVWTWHEPDLRFFGIVVGTRMTVMRTTGDGLVVCSPVTPTHDVRAAIDELGEVRAVVAPNGLHHLYAGDFCDAYPDAELWLSARLPKKRPDLAARMTGVLTDDAPRSFGGAVATHVFGGHLFLDEVVLFHKATRTLVLTDLVQQGDDTRPAGSRLAARLLGIAKRPAVPVDARATFTDRARARASRDRVLEWDFERIVLCHGPVVVENGREVFERAFAFLG